MVSNLVMVLVHYPLFIFGGIHHMMMIHFLTICYLQFRRPNTGLVANYCRLGGWTKGLRPWCYTMEEDTKWDYCDIPNCQGIPYSGVRITPFRVAVVLETFPFRHKGFYQC